jgi:carbon storage regulator
MLVLVRRPGESIMIGDSVTITVIRVDRNTVRLGIEAPQNVEIWREEIREERQGKPRRAKRRAAKP